jgi:hypothetical protein
MPEHEQAWIEVSRVLNEVHAKHPPATDSPEEEEEWIAKQVREFRSKRLRQHPEGLSGRAGAVKQ